jgi:hypothetical protein
METQILRLHLAQKARQIPLSLLFNYFWDRTLALRSNMDGDCSAD